MYKINRTYFFKEYNNEEGDSGAFETISAALNNEEIPTKNVIYCYINKNNKKMYIGQARNFKKRHSHHRIGDGIRNNSAIDFAFNKYGEEAFDVKIFISVPNMRGSELTDYLNAMEKYYIYKYNTFRDDFHYNLQEGGDNFGVGENHPMWTDEARVSKYGFDKGNQMFAIRYKGNIIKTSIYEDKLQELCDKINYEDDDTIPSGPLDYNYEAHVRKSGMHRGKQNYALVKNGEVLKTSIDKEQLLEFANKINQNKDFEIPEGRIADDQEVHIINNGSRKGKQIYALVKNSKKITTSINKEKLEKIAEKINKYGDYSDLEKEKLVIRKGGNFKGKQKYILKENGKALATSIDKEKLEYILNKMNQGIEFDYAKKEADLLFKKTNQLKELRINKISINKAGLRKGKQMYVLKKNGKIIKSSMDKEKLEYMAKELIKGKDLSEIESEFNKDQSAKIIKAGVRNGKQTYGLVQEGKMLKSSIDKELLKKIADKMNQGKEFDDIITELNKNKNKATVVKDGTRNGKQRYGLYYEGKVIKNSLDKELLKKIADKMNQGKEFDDIITELNKNKNKAHITKGGMEKGKQKYLLMQNGKRLTSSVFKDKLEKKAEEINKNLSM